MSHRENLLLAPVANPLAIVGGKDCKYRFTVLADGLVRYEWADDGVFEDRASTFAIRRDQPVPEFRVIDTEQGLEIITDLFQVVYDKKPFSANGFSIQVRGYVSHYYSLWRYGEVIKDLGGTARTLDEADGRIPLGNGVIGYNGFAGIDDSNTMLFESNGWVGARRPGNRIDGYLFTYGHQYREALQAFYAISGKPPLLPRWSLGNWWSRYYAYNAEEYITLMDKFREEEVPLAVSVVDMDWHLVNIDPKLGSGWTGYTWNKELFPNPPGFLKDMHKRNLKVTLNVHPGDGVRSHEESYTEMAKGLGHNTDFDDAIVFDVTNRKFMDAYFDMLHRKLEKEGVDFWWVDWQQGPYSKTPGIDPLWVLNHFHFIDNTFNRNRPLTFSRYAGPGSHRYPVGFSGDSVVTWASLQFQPEFTATAANVGYGWWSHDIGGHMGGIKSDELATRWVQLGTFSPILRLHSSNNPFNHKEPWSFGPEACKIMIDMLQLRHRLIPYLYTMNVRSARDGIQLIQPTYWAYPDTPEAYQFKNEYFFGSELLAVPITSPRDSMTTMSSVRAWLPPGRYVDIFSSDVYDGDRICDFHRPLAKIPVFAREGCIIPLDGSKVPENGGLNPTKMEIIVIVGANGIFELLEDDGTGTGIEDAEIVSTIIFFKQAEGTLTINPASSVIKGIASREWTVRFVGLLPVTNVTVTIDGKPDTVEHFKDNGNPCVRLASTPITATISMSVGINPQLQPTDVPAHLFTIIDDAQIEYNTKSAIWDVIKAKLSRHVTVSRLMALDLSKEMLSSLLEFVLADERSAA